MQINIFPTTIWKIDALNHPDDALNWALSQESGECVSRSNRNGFQSHSQGFETFPYLSHLQNQLKDLPSFQFLEWWVNINRKGDYNLAHIHAGSDLSGVWYLTDNHDSPIHFISPFAYTRREKEYYIKCNIGETLIFPSDLQHRVEPNPTEQPRVSIAFNLRLS